VTQSDAEIIKRTAARVGPNVVGLRGGARGSGTIIASGRVLTSAANLTEGEPEVVFADGRAARATVTGLDRRRGFAALSVETGALAPLAFGLESPPIGTTVLALANPWGRGLSATLGFVASSRNRPAPGVAHTALCPRGASGGPLVAPDGGLIGLNVMRLDGGFVFASATDTDTRERIEKLVAGERRSDRTLGVAIAPPRIARRLRRSVGLDERDGLLVRGVEADSAAFTAGIRQGDLIVAVGGAPIVSVDDLLAHLEGSGEEIPVTVVRGVDEHALTARLAP
jgi:S1-C subfamily serine protease